MKKLRPKSLGFKLWLYFMLFSAIILSILWLLQIVFLNSFYQEMKEGDIQKVAQEIAESHGNEDFNSTIDRLTFNNSILVYVTDQNGNISYSSDEHGGPKNDDKNHKKNRDDSLFRPLPQDYTSFLEKLNSSEEQSISYTYQNDPFPGESLIYGVKMDDDVLYISTRLDPVDATTSILKTQLIYVTITALFFGVLISYFIARRLARPITKITASAQQLATGNYDVHFDAKEYDEVEHLASTLNYTTKELSKVEQLRQELVANISHDLRTPLTMVKAYAEMIRDLSGDKKEKRETHLKVILDETDRLSLLVNDILELSKLQTDNEELHLQNVNLSECVQAILQRFAVVVAQMDYQIKSNIDPDQYVYADSIKIERVIYNLIGNAINYIGEDKLITINIIDLKNAVRFEVIDSGKGIPEEELAYIWDRYYKAKTHKRSLVSNGIGLSIVKKILEMHQARFGIDSQVCKVSLFCFELKK